MKRTPNPIPMALAVAAALLSACGGSVAPSAPSSLPAPGQKLNVLTTVEPLVNIIHNIGGDRITLDGIIPPGTDSHTFEPAPSDASRITRADVIFINGLQLEEPTRKLAQKNLKPGAEIVLLGELTVKPDEFVYDFSFPKEEGKPNPHLWMNPLNALRYAELARDVLIRRDAANSEFYRANYDKFKARIETLDVAIKATIETIPPQNRRLITYHDSFAYFAPRYGMTVLGAMQPSDFKEPTPREVAALIEQLKKEKLPAVFGSEVFPSKVLEQIKRESGTEFIDTLSDDALPGNPGAPNHTYVGMMVEDVTTMARALGGKPDAITKVDVTNTVGK